LLPNQEKAGNIKNLTKKKQQTNTWSLLLGQMISHSSPLVAVGSQTHVKGKQKLLLQRIAF
jgi:hypothetical protein